MKDILQLVAISSEMRVHAQACPALCNPMDCSCLAPLFVGFPRQYWNGLPFPPPGDLPDPGIKSMSLTSPALACRFFATRAIKEGQSILINHVLEVGRKAEGL